MENVFLLASYRDPNPLRSLEHFSAILKKTAKSPVDPEALEKIIIGAYSKETRPKTNAEKGAVDFLRWLYGIENRFLASKLKDFIELKGKEIQEAAERLASEIDRGRAVIVAGKETAEEAAGKLGVSAEDFPV